MTTWLANQSRSPTGTVHTTHSIGSISAGAVLASVDLEYDFSIVSATFGGAGVYGNTGYCAALAYVPTGAGAPNIVSDLEDDIFIMHEQVVSDGTSSIYYAPSSDTGLDFPVLQRRFTWRGARRFPAATDWWFVAQEFVGSLADFRTTLQVRLGFWD